MSAQETSQPAQKSMMSTKTLFETNKKMSPTRGITTERTTEEPEEDITAGTKATTVGRPKHLGLSILCKTSRGLRSCVYSPPDITSFAAHHKSTDKPLSNRREHSGTNAHHSIEIELREKNSPIYVKIERNIQRFHIARFKFAMTSVNNALNHILQRVQGELRG